VTRRTTIERRRDAGFTLVEALVVIGVLSALVSMGAVVLTQTLPAWRVAEAADDISSALRAARAKAALDGANVSVPFDVGRRLYTLVSATAPLGGVVSGSTLVVELPPGVTFTRPDSGGVVTFAPPAAPSDTVAVFAPSGLLLSNTRPADVHVGNTDDGVYRRVRVNLVGIVQVSRWTGTAWE